MPKVSVIIPCFNQGAFVDEAVDSVLSQTVTDVEIIIVNPGSTDDYTNQYLSTYQKPKTRVIHTERQRAGGARNTGIAHATGQYILPLDADDKIRPRYIEEAVEILDNQPEVSIVYCDAEFFGEKSGIADLPPYSLEQVLRANVIFNSSFFRRKDYDKTPGYNTNMIYNYEDWDFWLSVIELGGKVQKIEKPHYLYRIQQQGKLRQSNEEKIKYSLNRLYLNHQELYLSHFPDPLSLYYEKNKLSKELERLTTSREYRWGSKIVTTLRRIKRIVTFSQPKG